MDKAPWTKHEHIDPDKEILWTKIVIISLPINLNMCFVCSKEWSHWDGSFEYPQHMFWKRNKDYSLQYALLSGGLWSQKFNFWAKSSPVS